MSDWLKEWAAERGYQAAWVDYAVLDDAKRTIDDLAARDLIDRELYESIFSGFRYRPKEGSEELTTGIIISVPRAHNYVVFETTEGPLRAVLPATYLEYTAVRDRVRSELESQAAELFPTEGYRFESMSAPFKSVATRAGIVTYGRNNITYAQGCGSSHQLVGFFTNAKPAGPVEMVDPQETFGKAGGSAMCLHCDACVRVCPTGALTGERFTIRASRCVTYLNEYPGPWPEWLSPTVHNSLVGCMRCQEVCPRNRGHLVFEEAPESFTREETEAILATAEAGEKKSSEWTRPAGPVWESIARKLAVLGQSGLESFLGRNLKALMEAEKARR
ncbi:MAG: 4Fe-4S double cluster binding domain-containing protein [Bacillota bacterium]